MYKTIDQENSKEVISKEKNADEDVEQSSNFSYPNAKIQPE